MHPSEEGETPEDELKLRTMILHEDKLLPLNVFNEAEIFTQSSCLIPE